ncbi:histone H1-like repetitive region-containing protein [Streptomyces roseolus]|uniref:histone H1-like repetitive region-containing protein n=1 Tax=Streptomyces roseolus TaxID=67358 RepID=UPI003652A0D6
MKEAARKEAAGKKTAVKEAAVPKAAGKKAAAKKTAAKKTAGKEPAGKEPVGKETVTKKAAGKKAAAKETAAKETAGKKAVAEKTAVTKAVAGKAAVTEPVAGEATAREPAGAGADDARAPVERAVAEEAAVGSTPGADVNPPGKKSVKKTVGRKAAAKKQQTGARTVAAKKTAGGVTTAEDEAAVPPARTGELAVRPGEEPWTPEEVAEARSELQAEVLRLRSELAHSEEELTGLMRDSGDGAGHDEADTGTKNITREHELALAANAREMLEQTEHALERLDAGTYGLCEVCGKPIGKARMQAFPRATLCVEDKQKQERRG